MLGGNLVNISGPCFGPNTLVKCRFYDREVAGVVRDSNTAFCVQPRLFATGYVDIAVSLDGGPYYWKGQFYVGQWHEDRRDWAVRRSLRQINACKQSCFGTFSSSAVIQLECIW